MVYGEVIVLRVVDWQAKMRDESSNAELSEKVIRAIEKLFRDDAELLHRNTNERSITALLACHLRPLLLDWHVDCEFNRNDRNSRDIKMADGNRVVPDIIIHRRDTGENLLAIEVKQGKTHKADSPGDRRDIEKLKRFRTGELQYKSCLFVKFVAGDPVPGIWRMQWI